MQPRYRGHRITAATAILFAFALLSLLASVPATGGPLNDCYRSAENRLDVRPCLEVLLTEADAQLIEAEQFRRQQLAELANVTGRGAALKAFEQAAKDFRVFRESACRLARLEAEPGTGAGDFELDCMVRLTLLWTDQLLSRSSPH